MTDCIEHTQKGNSGGYGRTCRVVAGKKVSVGLHRVAFAEHNQCSLESIAGVVIRHKCDNPRCINPHHLEVGTHTDNMYDMVSRGRSATGSKHGRAVLDEVQVTQIKELLRNRVPQREVARRYGISQRTVGKIGRGELWTHVT